MTARASRVALAAIPACAAAGAIACILHMFACGTNDGTHVYQGRLYLETRGCLGTTSSLDVVSGDIPGECPPICLSQSKAEGGRTIYVATMCPPLPGPEFDTSGKDPACAPALAALARNDTCLSDGGSTQPIPKLDAGAD